MLKEHFRVAGKGALRDFFEEVTYATWTDQIWDGSGSDSSDSEPQSGMAVVEQMRLIVSAFEELEWKDLESIYRRYPEDGYKLLAL